MPGAVSHGMWPGHSPCNLDQLLGSQRKWTPRLLWAKPFHWFLQGCGHSSLRTVWCLRTPTVGLGEAQGPETFLAAAPGPTSLYYTFRSYHNQDENEWHPLPPQVENTTDRRKGCLYDLGQSWSSHLPGDERSWLLSACWLHGMRDRQSWRRREGEKETYAESKCLKSLLQP